MGRRLANIKLAYIFLAGGFALLGWGVKSQGPWWAVAGAVTLGTGCWLIRRRRQAAAKPADPPTGASQVIPSAPPVKVNEKVHRLRSTYAAAGTAKSDAVIEELIRQGRYALLLRNEVLGNLSTEQRQMVASILQDEMAFVRGGDVRMMVSDPNGMARGSGEETIVATDDIYMERFAVTNEDYKRFVDDRGYQSAEYWIPAIVDAVSQFTDRTGRLGPRFWQDGRYADGCATHPVVGINYYEAQAYARWAGKRLPTDAEWVRAAAAPVAVSEERIQQRKYPWGDAVDESRANLWSSGLEQTVSVAAFSAGDSVHGLRQMVGNVWEWTSDRFGCWSPWEAWRDSDCGYRSLRGGAFDTYFESQACCLFQSGDHPLARKHNIGLRCAVPAALVPAEMASRPSLVTA